MGWSGSGVYSRSNGTFTGPTVWEEDNAAGTLITTANHDNHDQDLADGINACLTKNGENAATANLPMGGFRHTGVGNASARNHYTSVASLQDASHVYVADTGAADVYAIAPVPSIGAYAAGQKFRFQAANTNTGASTINVNALGAKAIVKNVSTALAAGDITLNGIYEVAYDGTNFQVITPPLARDYGSTGISADVIAESTPDAGVTLDGVLLKDDEVTTDTINEKTPGAGVTSDGVLLKDGAATLTGNLSIGGQAFIPPQTLTDQATVTWDADAGSFATLTLAGNRTLAKPTNLKAGGTYQLYVFQDGTGNRTLDYAAGIAWPGSVEPVLSVAANALDIITFSTWNGTALFGTIQHNFGVP